MADNLQVVVDKIREVLARNPGVGVYYEIEVPDLARPIRLSVTPDGVTWIVRIENGSNVIFDSAVVPAFFVNGLYSLLRWTLRECKAQAEKPS